MFEGCWFQAQALVCEIQGNLGKLMNVVPIFKKGTIIRNHGIRLRARTGQGASISHNHSRF